MATSVAMGNLSASGKAADGDGRLVGVFVATSSSLTLKIQDGRTATGNVIINTTAAITAPVYFPMPANFKDGLYVTIGGTGNYTVFYER